MKYEKYVCICALILAIDILVAVPAYVFVDRLIVTGIFFSVLDLKVNMMTFGCRKLN